jgi:hypothetical protein
MIPVLLLPLLLLLLCQLPLTASWHVHMLLPLLA